LKKKTKNKKLYLNSTVFLVVSCIFVLATVTVGIRNYRLQMQAQLEEISKTDLRANSDSISRSISTRLSNAIQAVRDIADTYSSSTNNLEFASRVKRLSYTSYMGQLTYHYEGTMATYFNNMTDKEANTPRDENGDLILDPEFHLPLIDIMLKLQTQNQYCFFQYTDNTYCLSIAVPVRSKKGELVGFILSGYTQYRYKNLNNSSNFFHEDSIILVDNTGFCTLDHQDNLNVNYFDYLNTLQINTGSVEELKQSFADEMYGFLRYTDPQDGQSYYLTYAPLGLFNLIVCDRIPSVYVEEQMSKLNASSDDMILTIFSVIFIMIILIFIVESISTLRIRRNQNKLLLEQDRFRTVMKYTQSAIWEYQIHRDIMEKPDANIGIYLDNARTVHFEKTALEKNAIYEDDIPVFKIFCEELRQGKPNIASEFRAKDATGKFVWFSAVGNTVYDMKGNATTVIGQITNIDHEKQEIEALKNLSERDPLTKLYNRKTAQNLINKTLENSTEVDIHAFCMIDVDNFKSINDNYGHIFGDAVLTEISSKLKGAFEKEHIVSRYGGDEFTIFIKNAPSEEYIEEKAKLINDLLKEIYVGENSERQITTSVGIAIYPRAGTTQKTLMVHADTALYYSKNAGKSCYHIYNDDMEQKGSIVQKKQFDNAADEHKGTQILWDDVDISLMTQVIDFLFDAHDLRSSLNMILSLVGTSFNLSRISIEEYSYDQKEAFLTYDWINPTQKIKTIPYKKRTVKEADATNYFKLIPNGVFYTNDVFHMEYPIPENIASSFRKIQLKCLYQCGFSDNGIYHGYLQAAIHNDSRRTWTQKELSTLTMISKIIGGYILKLSSQELAKDIEEKDFLTNSYNFFKFISVADNMISTNPKKRYVFVYTDIDMFKYINTTYGYSEGDNVLREFSRIIRENLQDGETYCRAAADKFIILMHYVSHEETSKRMNALMQAWYLIRTMQGSVHKITVKAGLYVTKPQETATLAIDQANIARQSIHESHKSIYLFFDNSMKSTLIKQKEIEDIMDEALVNEEFLVYYQPKFNLSTDKMCGAEALVRWKRPDRLIPPNEFIPIFESNEFIVELDYYMLRKVCLLIRQLLDTGKDLVPISVNFSPVHLRDQNFVLKLTNIVDNYHIPRKYIEVELTESAMFEDSNYLLATLNTLHELGFRLSMDDFGSGYSSLNLLRILPFDVIKLDKEFFHHGSATTREQIIISNVIKMLKQLKMQIVAEGVETEEQAQFLKNLECNIAQGYLYERPTSEKKFKEKYFNL